MRNPARPIKRQTSAPHRTPTVSTTTPTCSCGNSSARSDAWPGGESTARSAQSMGCSASRASRTLVTSVGGELAERIPDPIPRPAQVAGTRRQTADDHHEALGLGRGRLVDRPPVVVQRPLRRQAGGEEAAAAQRAHSEARVVSQAGGTLESDLGHRFSPQPHGLESGGADTLHHFGEGPRVDRHLVDRQAPQPDVLVRAPARHARHHDEPPGRRGERRAQAGTGC